ncbi:MAG: OsmC family protein [Nitrospirae bacterium]|jgi:uncharacterized OsmC-like protein|nr:OsmC family protein [Nitrospirota bacterium]
MNHVNLEALEKTIALFRAEPGKARKENVLEGEWNTKGAGPQFHADLAFEGGKLALEMDNPRAMGGEGLAPGPLQYCLFGMASCFAGTFMMVAAQQGVEIRRLRIRVENVVDMTRPLGISHNPLTDGVRIRLSVSSPSSEVVLQKIEEQSREQCPAVWCLTNPIPLSIALEREE